MYSLFICFSRRKAMKVTSIIVAVALAFAICSFVVTPVRGSDVIELNDDNFEHLTQATTGSTTGHWFVELYASSSLSFATI
jgi:nucleoside permease NupC